MFTLTDKPIEQIQINGRKYDVDMSFDNILRLIDMLDDNELSDAIQIITGIQMLFGTQLDMPLAEQAEAFNEAYLSLIGAEQKEVEYDILGNPMPTQADGDNEVWYDFKQDAKYIYASFMQDYGIDLIEQQGKLHWYKFQALLAGLSEDTKFKKVLEIRQMELPTGKGSGKQRKAIEELKKAYELKPKK